MSPSGFPSSRTDSDYEYIRDYDYRRMGIGDTAEDILLKGILEFGQDIDELGGLTEAIRNTFCIKHIEKLEMENHSVIADIGLVDTIRGRVANLMDQKRAMVPNIITDKLNEGIEHETNIFFSDINFSLFFFLYFLY